MSFDGSLDKIESAKDSDVYQPRINEYSQKVLDSLLEEKQRLSDDFPFCAILIDEAIDRLFSTGRVPGKEYYADVFRQKPMKVTQKVFVPSKQYPKFNFTGKILGPKGNSLRRLQEETQCKIIIKGRNSIRDNAKEEELRTSGDIKFAHFNKDLYLEISTVAPPAESYARIAYALAEIRKYIIPDKNDEVSQEQLREIMEMNPDYSKNALGAKSHAYKSILDRTMPGAGSAPKYANLIKRTAAYHPDEEVYEHEADEVVYEYSKPYVVKRPTFEYTKVRPSMSTQKRSPTTTVYATEIKRSREAPSTPYKPNPYAMFKKYR